MKYFMVSFKYCENIFCSNLCIAASKEDVVEHYSESYGCVTVKDAADWEVESCKRRGMPIITL